MSEKQEKVLYICTSGQERPEIAHMPFVLANAALAMDIQASIVLQAEAVHIARVGFAATMHRGGGFPPMQQLLDSFLEQGGKIKVCGPCIKSRDIAESDLIPGAEVTAAGALNLEAMEADAVFVY